MSRSGSTTVKGAGYAGERRPVATAAPASGPGRRLRPPSSAGRERHLDRSGDPRAVFHDAIARWAPNPVMQEVALPGASAAVEFANCSTLDTPYRTLGGEAQAAAIERGTSVSRDGPTATSDSAIIPLG